MIQVLHGVTFANVGFWDLAGLGLGAEFLCRRQCACRLFARIRNSEVDGRLLPGKDMWLASTSAIFTLCSPRGKPAMSTVLLSLASAHHQGRSSTMMCRRQTRGDTSTAPSPKTCTMRMFSTRYRAQKTPIASPRKAADRQSAWPEAHSRSQRKVNRREFRGRSARGACGECAALAAPATVVIILMRFRRCCQVMHAWR